MSIGASLFLIAVGAILKFAITTSVSGVNIATIGLILMIIGGLGLVISLLFLLQADRRDDVAVARRPPPPPDPYDRRGL